MNLYDGLKKIYVRLEVIRQYPICAFGVQDIPRAVEVELVLKIRDFQAIALDFLRVVILS